MNISILVADDFDPWRRFVSWLIAQRKPGWSIVCEVSDGVEAVEKAGDLRPELILLDIGLPRLDGIEAARQINQIAPCSKILFLSGFDSLEVVEEALNTGATGYVLKLDAVSELIWAVEAVLQGKRFVSSGLAGGISAQVDNAPAGSKLVREQLIASRSVPSPEVELGPIRAERSAVRLR
jgi:DNA-binding NarL/FixJ family response regulator